MTSTYVKKAITYIMAPFNFITTPCEVSRTNNGLNHITVNNHGQITVCFDNVVYITIPLSCKMYDAPHLICWNEDNSEVGFFARFRDKYENGREKDCMCMINRNRETADMWFLHSTPSEVILEPCRSNPDKLRITPIVNGIHAVKSPFNFDDSLMVQCEVTKKVTEEKPLQQVSTNEKQNAKLIIWMRNNILLKLQSIDRGIRLRALTFFVMMFSTFTYHTGKLFYLLINYLSTTKLSIVEVYVIESVVLYFITLLFRRSKIHSWVFVIASALWLGCVIFNASIAKQI